MRLKKFLILTLCLSSVLRLWADRIKVPSGDYEIFLPVGWTIYDRSDLSHLSFLSDDESAVLEISYYSGDQFSDTQEMYDQLLSHLGGEVDVSQFLYVHWNAWLADISFTLEGQQYRGWFLLLDGDEWDYQITLFTPLSYYDQNFPWMVSAMDSFSPGQEALRLPGVISTMMELGESQESQITLYPQGNASPYVFNQSLLQISQDFIEREAKLLHQYSVNRELFHLAWDRYYNLIYRDNFLRLYSLATALEPWAEPMNRQEWMEALLSWIQEFEYSSSGTFSDLLSPMSSAVCQQGDCDSLSLLYLIILEYYGIQGILLVSEEYSHAMVAVPSDIEGASIEYKGTRYVVAELTDQVEMGQIPSSMSDLEKWQIIAFY